MLGLLVMALCAVLNRLRGDDSWKPSWLPGRALFYVAPAIGLVAWILLPWYVAAAFAVAYFLWAVSGWGFVLMRIGGLQPDRQPDAVEKILLMLPGTILPVFTRSLFVLPGVVLIAMLIGRPEYWLMAPIFAAVATVFYHVLLRPIGTYDWLRAELVIGALWAVMIVAARPY